MKKTLFIKNALILTVSSLILRFAGIVFKVWLASAVGSEGIGLYQLVFSVYVLASTFAASGISTAVTRLVSEELALGSRGGCMKILKTAFVLTAVIAAISLFAVCFGADFTAERLLGDTRAAASLKILPFSLPIMGISSCLRGYFIARRRIIPNAATQIFEQAARITIIFILVRRFAEKGLAVCCAAVIFGDCAAELLSCAALFVSFLFDNSALKKLSGRKAPPYSVLKRLTGIAAPITSGRYLNSLLRTAENILVPQRLAQYRSGGSNALSQFGMIKGMALPILFFPSAVLNAVSTLLIPEMSEAVAMRRGLAVKSSVRSILRLTCITSYIFSAVFFTAGDALGILIYGEKAVGSLLRALSPIVPLMYLDSISDGLLKGLDRQSFVFKTAVSDSLIRIILITAILPFSGLKGFIAIMYFSNFLTCFMNVGKLLKTTGAFLKPIDEIFLPLIAAYTSALLSCGLLRLAHITDGLLYVGFSSGLSLMLYLFFLVMLGTVTLSDFTGLFPKRRVAEIRA